jgi:hypothetical protein
MRCCQAVRWSTRSCAAARWSAGPGSRLAGSRSWAACPAPAARAAAGRRCGRSWRAAWGRAGCWSRPARPDGRPTRPPGAPRPQTANRCSPPPRTCPRPGAACPARRAGPPWSLARCDPGGSRRCRGPPSRSDLGSVHVQPTYDAHRDLLRAPPLWPAARPSVPEPEGVPAHVIFSVVLTLWLSKTAALGVGRRPWRTRSRTRSTRRMCRQRPSSRQQRR